jgi:hypothetical protein
MSGFQVPGCGPLVANYYGNHSHGAETENTACCISLGCADCHRMNHVASAEAARLIIHNFKFES